MLTQIKLTNFKRFETETTFPLSQLNLLTGVNGRGKSTLLQSLLLMRQTTDRNETATAVFLNGSCLNLGTFEDVRNQNASKEAPIIFEYLSPNHLLRYQLGKNREDETTLVIQEVMTASLKFKKTTRGFQAYDFAEKEVTGLVTLFNLAPKLIDSFEESLWSGESVFDKIHYLSTSRLIDGLQSLDFTAALAKFPQVGAKGEFTANILYEKCNHTVAEDLCLDVHHALASQTNTWLNQILESVPIEVVLRRFQEARLLDILFKTNYGSNEHPNRPANMGFGYSQALPIIVSGLLAKEGEILIIENPEAHLHPKAQSRLIQFLAQVSNGGTQVFIESHSEHILNGLRLAVLKKIIAPEKLSILYFEASDEQLVRQIPINADGELEEWPEDFFDQEEIDLAEMFHLRKQQQKQIIKSR
jgi:predicted ATPase